MTGLSTPAGERSPVGGMPKGRLEAFSDGVIAILITIMVLELHRPQDVTWKALCEDVPVLAAYALSFVYLGIYWNNHHHMLAAVRRVNGASLWANLHLLFWLSLVPFATAWMSQNDFQAVPTAVYGIVLLAAAVAYYVLQGRLLRTPGNSLLAEAIGRDLKGKSSPFMYILAIALALLARPWMAVVVYVAVTLMWFVPDRRLERRVTTVDAGF